jgi:hypothetical protein
MGRSKNRKGGEVSDEQIESDFQKLQNQLSAAQESLNNLGQKLNVGPEMQPEGPVMQPEGPVMQPEGPEMQPEGPEMQPEGPEMQPEVMNKPWQENKDLKFKDGAGGRVTLSFPRILMLLDNNIKQSNTNKPWAEIKNKLLEATSIQEVQNLINQYSIRFSSNSIGGTRKKTRWKEKKNCQKMLNYLIYKFVLYIKVNN